MISFPPGTRVIVEGQTGIVLESTLVAPYVMIAFPNGDQVRYNVNLVDIQLAT